jgi:hypothetical protein
VFTNGAGRGPNDVVLAGSGKGDQIGTRSSVAVQCRQHLTGVIILSDNLKAASANNFPNGELEAGCVLLAHVR